MAFEKANNAIAAERSIFGENLDIFLRVVVNL